MNNTRSTLNKLYKPIIDKFYEITFQFVKLHGGYDCTSGFYNGHYHKNENSNYQEDKYPIPVISVTNICDIEIDFDNICITSKLSKEQIQSFDLDKLKDYAFEVYGVKNYLKDYGSNLDINCIKQETSPSKETEFFVSFHFPFETSGEDILKFVRILRKWMFYY